MKVALVFQNYDTGKLNFVKGDLNDNYTPEDLEPVVDSMKVHNFNDADVSLIAVISIDEHGYPQWEEI